MARFNPRTKPSMSAAVTTRAVLFDLDGTLISTKRLYLEAYRKALAAYVGRELADHDLLAMDSRTELRLLGSFVNGEQLPACTRAFHLQYEVLHSTHFDGVYPGVPELLTRLRKRQIKIGIVSGKSRVSWSTTSAHASLGDFDVLVMADDVPAPKPDPRGLLGALEALGVAPAEAIYVGDSIYDLDAAAAAGVMPAAVLWSKRGPRRDAFIHDAEQRGARLLASPTDLLAVTDACGSMLDVDDEAGRAG